MNKKTYIIFILSLLLFFPYFVIAQNSISLKGKVFDESGTGLPGASVIVSGSGLGTISNPDGSFQLNGTKEFPVKLLISFVGFATQEIEIYDNDPLSVTLQKDINRLDEVVITGYTKSRRNARASSISTIASTDINKVSATSFNEEVQGQVAGLQISGTYGIPGSAVFVRLRGTTSINAGNSPLYVVDGVFINEQTLQSIGTGGQTTNPLSDINPLDIEKVEILKDANATAIFGARGSNGVIIITTKRGKKNEKSKISLNAEHGFSKIYKLWEQATGPDHATIVNEAWVNDGNPYQTRPFRPVEEIVNGNPGLGEPESQKTYDKLSPLLRTAQQQSYNLSVKGGDEKTTYFLSGDYTYQEATIKVQDFKRLSFRANIDHNISKKLAVGLSSSYIQTIRKLSPTGDTGGVLNTGIHDPTLQPIFNPDGTYALTRFTNPYVLLENNNRKSFGKHLVGNIYFKWNILENLSFKSSWSLDDNYYREKVYNNSNLSQTTNGSGTDATSTKKIWIAEQLLNYNATIGENNFLSVFLGNTLQKSEFDRVYVSGTNYPSNEFSELVSAAITSGLTSGTSSGLISYFGGANFSYHNKYSADFNLRTDASSRFGANNRWALFPSGGLSWRISEEQFLKDNFKFINELKIKTSLGFTGNQNIDDFASLGLWQGGQNYQDKPGISPKQLPNENLKWETTRQFNIGLESSLFKNRLSFEFNYYEKKTTDLLLNVPVPVKSGFSSSIQNLGELSNKGIEFEIRSTNISNKNFEWTTSFNITQNKNIITKLPSSFSQYRRDWVRLEQGKPLYSFWLYKQLYVDPQTGDAVYEDVNKDGKITTDDRQILGDAWPDFYGGIKNGFRFKNFDLSVFFYFSYGNKVFSMNRYFLEHGGQRGVSWALSKSMMDRWQKPGDITDIPRSKTLPNADGSSNHSFESSRFLEDGSFIRLRNVSVGYNLPRNIISKVHFANVRIYANGTNLLTFTNYSGADPEVNTASDFSNGTVQGLDFSVPPQPRSIVFGINATF